MDQQKAASNNSHTTIAKYLNSKLNSSSTQLSPMGGDSIVSEVPSNFAYALPFNSCSTAGTRTTGGICSVLLEVVEKLCDEEEVLSEPCKSSNISSGDQMMQQTATTTTTTSNKKSNVGKQKERRSSRSSGRTVRHIKDLLNCSDELRRNTIEIQQNNPKRKRKTPTSENVNVLINNNGTIISNNDTNNQLVNN